MIASGILTMWLTVTCNVLGDSAVLYGYMAHLCLEAVEIGVLIALTTTAITDAMRARVARRAL